MATEIKKYLDHAGLSTYNEKIKKVITDGDAQAVQDAKDYADGLALNYEAAGSIATAVDALKNNEIKANTDAIAEVDEKLSAEVDNRSTEIADVYATLMPLTEDVGSVGDLSTTNKTVVTAINEVLAAVGTGGTAAVVTLEKSTDGLTYTLKQGTTTVGTINIPKDMVVESGEVVVNPEGQSEGTYIKLTLANVEDPLYINVGTLVDIYKAKANATQVQVAIDSSTREISATIVAGSVGATELASNAVTTAKIADANVTKVKLSNEVQTSLTKADGAAPQTALDAEINRATVAEAKALEDAKAYVDSKVAGVDLTGIATNAADIDKLEASLAEGGATANAIADAKKAGTDAATAVTSLQNGVVKDNSDAILALEAKVGEGFEAIATAEIEALFA